MNTNPARCDAAARLSLRRSPPQFFALSVLFLSLSRLLFAVVTLRSDADQAQATFDELFMSNAFLPHCLLFVSLCLLVQSSAGGLHVPIPLTRETHAGDNAHGISSRLRMATGSV